MHGVGFAASEIAWELRLQAYILSQAAELAVRHKVLDLHAHGFRSVNLVLAARQLACAYRAGHVVVAVVQVQNRRV